MRVYADRVGESTTTTGTGDFTLAGSIPGHQTFASAAAAGDTFDYAAFAVDGNNAPSGDWETGTGTATSTGFSRTVQQSSNANALVDFAAGTKVVLLTQNSASIKAMLAAIAAGGGGGGGSGGVAPTIVQTASARNDNPTVNLPAKATAGNTIVLVATGFPNYSAPSGFGVVGSFNQSNQSGMIFAKVADGSEQAITFSSGGTNDGQMLAYEFEGAVAVFNVSLSYASSGDFAPYLTQLIVPQALWFLFAECDTSSVWTASSNLTVDYATPSGQSGNHYGIFAHTASGFSGTATLHVGNGDNKVVGQFAVGVPSSGGS